MEINMVQRRHPFSLQRPCLPALPAACPVERPSSLLRLRRLVRTVVRTGAAVFDWLNRLGARPLDPEALERARSRHGATLRIKSIGH